MSPIFGFDESDAVDSTLVPDLDLPVHDDLESQMCAGCQVCDNIPQEVEDPCYFGTEINTYHRCFHGHMPDRNVAFDMSATGRRFIGCPLKGKHRCRFVIWIDKPWNPVLTRALINIWTMVGLKTTDLPGVYGFHANTDLALHDSSPDKVAPSCAGKRYVMETKNIVGWPHIMLSKSISVQSNLVVAAFSSLLTICIVLPLVVLFR